MAKIDPEATPQRFSVGLSEVAIRVSSVERSVHFYTDVVRLEVDEMGEQFALLWAGEPGQLQRVILLREDLPPLKDRDHDGLATPPFRPGSPLADLRPGMLGPTHFALHVPVERLESAVDHVRSRDIEIWGPVDFGGLASAYYFLDPDGHWVEFYTPRG